MSQQCILTDYGYEQITRAIVQGTTITINKVRLGSTNSFTLESSMITIPDIVYTSTSSTNLQSVVVSANTLEFRCYFGTNIGPFNIGSVGIYDSNDSLVMVGKFDTLYQKKITTTTESGNTFQFTLPIYLSNVGQGAVVTQQQFQIDQTTIRLNSNNQLSCQVVPHHVFDIFMNASTATPAGAFPMWTGEIVDCYSSRTDFWNEAVSRQTAGTIRTLTEAQWQSEVTANGWTNAFVLNTTLHTVRLPKLIGIPQAINTSGASLTNKVTSGSSGLNVMPLPLYIQVETTAVPATMTQCSEFSNLLRQYIAHFEEFDNTYVKLAGTNTASSTNTWTGVNTFTQTIQGTALRAQWADLAEMYKSDKQYPVGTLVKFGGSAEITAADFEANGVISTKPGLILDSYEGQASDAQPVALTGKVPVRVVGTVNKFDKLTLSDIDGVATVSESSSDDIIGIALESKADSEEGLVLCVTKLKF